jgi:hypothetical protein
MLNHLVQVQADLESSQREIIFITLKGQKQLLPLHTKAGHVLHDSFLRNFVLRDLKIYIFSEVYNNFQFNVIWHRPSEAKL